MQNIKWHYDVKWKNWWVGESVPYANDDISITKDGKSYMLVCGMSKVVGHFKKLSSAKIVAQLLRHG